MIIRTLLFCAILALATSIGIVEGADYSHDYDTIGIAISFSTPPGITAEVDWGEGDSFSPIDITLSTGDALFPWLPRRFYDFESRDSNTENLEKIWSSDADHDQYSLQSITELDNGDYIISGRMIRMGSMITRITRTFDFDNDGKLDSYMQWNGRDKVDYNTMNHLASTDHMMARMH